MTLFYPKIRHFRETTLYIGWKYRMKICELPEFHALLSNSVFDQVHCPWDFFVLFWRIRWFELLYILSLSVCTEATLGYGMSSVFDLVVIIKAFYFSCGTVYIYLEYAGSIHTRTRFRATRRLARFVCWTGIEIFFSCGFRYWITRNDYFNPDDFKSDEVKFRNRENRPINVLFDKGCSDFIDNDK